MPPRAVYIQENVPLAPYTTFRIGGPARFFCEVTTTQELLEAVTFARECSLPLFVLGGGSNLLVTDQGFDGLVLRVKIEGAINTGGGYREDRPRQASVTYDVPGGMDWDAFVLKVAKAGVTGIECLAGIPGFAGGAPIQNIGAYGQEVSTSILWVHVLDLETLNFVSLTAKDCGFAYRCSIFNTTHRNRYIVISVTFRLDLDATPTLRYADLKDYFAGRGFAPKPIDIYHAVREIRHRKGMLILEGEDDCRSAGSFFKNPVVPAAVLQNIAATLTLPVDKIPHWPAGEDRIKLPAAWLLERAGFPKGFQRGEAGISSRHTLALINRGHASFADIAGLRDTIQCEVAQRFGIQLEQEPVQLGE
ncbi:UDP-N-acetylmuramate dehydrogenase [Granulicella sp. S190]|uniref:UDP-N-acetylmuramate dehydrogenase n=1 Tax=Granulicella sp. S190 TaxID=1747226 RepID=UPI00131D1BF4|nr:UDP-N-acetylmuramate dehydrogenase [Granulicella sp. S190]